MINTILFDMDGVLIDAREWHYEALNRALRLFGYVIERDNHLATYDGLPTRKKLELLSRNRTLPNGLHGIISELKQRYTMEIAQQLCKPSFNHRYALSRLKQDGYRLGLCSNSIKQTIELMVYLAGLTDYLEIRLSNEDVLKSKPDPEIYNLAMTKLGTSPSETLILEDNEHGIRAAYESGAHVLVIPSPDFVTYQNIKSRIEDIQNGVVFKQ